jgi:hypothetical protein
MHPPPAKELMAVSISGVRGCAAGLALSERAVRVVRDSRDVSVWPLAFTAQSPAVASALIAFFNRMVFVPSRIAMRGNSSLWLLLAFAATAFAGFAAMLPIFAALVGTPMETFNRLVIFQNWIQGIPRADAMPFGLIGPHRDHLTDLALLVQLGFCSDFQSPVRTWNEHHVGLL